MTHGKSRTGVGWLCFGFELTRTRGYLTFGPYTYWIDWRQS